MEELIKRGWQFIIYQNALGTITIEAKHKACGEVVTDGFKWYQALGLIGDKIDEKENNLF